MKSVFFYGLFMDEDLLKNKGFHPTNKKLAFADGFGLRIGEKATLIKSASERSYGIVMDLSEDEINRLYSAPGVEEYLPEEIEVFDMNGNADRVLCYNLPISKLTGSNKEYAKSLSAAAQKMGLPESYIEQILTWVK